jgi:hypothetical protein
MTIDMNVDVIIVLGDMLKSDGSMSENLKDRVEEACKLFREADGEGIKLPIIMSGSCSFMAPYKTPRTEANAMKEFAIEKFGIPKDKILLEEESKDTIGNAFFTKIKYLKPNNWKKIIVATTNFNMERTKYIFENILGPRYLIQYLETPNRLSSIETEKQQAMEKKIIEFIKSYVEQIDPNNDEKTKKFLYTEHPAYAKNPKITKEQILEMMKQS